MRLLAALGALPIMLLAVIGLVFSSNRGLDGTLGKICGVSLIVIPILALAQLRFHNLTTLYLASLAPVILIWLYAFVK
jgi:hypothetical protein